MLRIFFKNLIVTQLSLLDHYGNNPSSTWAKTEEVLSLWCNLCHDGSPGPGPLLPKQSISPPNVGWRAAHRCIIGQVIGSSDFRIHHWLRDHALVPSAGVQVQISGESSEHNTRVSEDTRPQIISMTGQGMTSSSSRILEEIFDEKYSFFFFSRSRHQGSDVNENSFHARWINPGRWTTTIKHRLCPGLKTWKLRKTT